MSSTNAILSSVEADTVVGHELDGITDNYASEEAMRQCCVPSCRKSMYHHVLTNALEMHDGLNARAADVDFKDGPHALAF